jgi:tRNA nucleotidyltransferase/poly(A) polymerase
MEEIVEDLLNFGCVIVGGYVRDVVIRGEKECKDIDVVCETHLLEGLVDFLSTKYASTYKQFLLQRNHNSKILDKARICLACYVNNIFLDMCFYDPLELKTAIAPFCCKFYLTKTAFGAVHISPDETLVSLLEDCRKKRFKRYSGELSPEQANWVNKKVESLVRRGWVLHETSTQSLFEDPEKTLKVLDLCATPVKGNE